MKAHVSERIMAHFRAVRLVLLVGALLMVLCTGCSSSNQSSSTSSSSQPSQNSSSDQSAPTDSSDLSATTSQKDVTPEEPTGYAAKDEADGYQTLGGYWKVVAITYKGKAVPLSAAEGLEDLYDNVFLGFSKDGSFEYRLNVFITRGKYVPVEDKDGYFLLKAETVSRATIEDGKITETESERTSTVYLVVTTEDPADTLGFVELDTSTGKPKEGENPIYFTKSGSESDSASSSKDDAAKERSESSGGSTSGNGMSTYGSGNHKAVERAQQYLRTTSFSHDGLVSQLEYEGFSHEDAVYGADACGADWNEQAALKAKQYLQTTAFSEKGLIEQLVYEEFTQSQAEYGVSVCGADWMEQAVKKARQYMSWSSMSHSQLVEQLEYEGFTHEQAVYGADNA